MSGNLVPASHAVHATGCWMLSFYYTCTYNCVFHCEQEELKAEEENTLRSILEENIDVT